MNLSFGLKAISQIRFLNPGRIQLRYESVLWAESDFKQVLGATVWGDDKLGLTSFFGVKSRIDFVRDCSLK